MTSPSYPAAHEVIEKLVRYLDCVNAAIDGVACREEERAYADGQHIFAFPDVWELSQEVLPALIKMIICIYCIKASWSRLQLRWRLVQHYREVLATNSAIRSAEERRVLTEAGSARECSKNMWWSMMYTLIAIIAILGFLNPLPTVHLVWYLSRGDVVLVGQELYTMSRGALEHTLSKNRWGTGEISVEEVPMIVALFTRVSSFCVQWAWLSLGMLPMVRFLLTASSGIAQEVIDRRVAVAKPLELHVRRLVEVHWRSASSAPALEGPKSAAAIAASAEHSVECEVVKDHDDDEDHSSPEDELSPSS